VLRAAREYAIAVALVAASVLLELIVSSLSKVESNQLNYLTFFPAVIVAVAFLGRGPAVAAILLSLPMARWLHTGPGSSVFLNGGSPAELIGPALFLAAGIALLFFSANSRRALGRERSAVKALESKSLELAASEEFNRRMLASIPDCVNVLALDGQVLSINEAGKRLFELGDTSVWLRNSWVQNWPEDHHDMVKRCMQRAAQGKSAQFIANCLTARGQMRWWDVVLSPIYDRNGNPERLLAISRDVTERQQAELSRIESEERRRMVIEATDDAVWDLDLSDGRFTVNDSYRRNYGAPENEDWREWFRRRTHSEDRERVDAAFEAALKGTTLNWTSEYRLLRSDGQWGRVLDRAYIARDRHGQPKRVVGAMMNLLPLLKAEWRAELLAETSSLLLRADSPQNVVNALCMKVLQFLQCDVFFNFLIDGKANELRLNAFGGPDSHPLKLGQSLDSNTVCSCVAQEGAPVIAEDIQNSNDPRLSLVRSMGIQAYACNPLVVRGKTVGTLSFGTRSRTRFDMEEIALMQAVTDQVAIAMERQRNEQELRQINEELEQRVAQRTRSLEETTEQLNSFCYSVAHDLRAPLRTQTGFARLLLDDYSSVIDETGRYYLKAIMQAAERQSNIIQDLMAHVNVSRADLTMETISLDTAVQEAISDLEVELQQKEASVEISELDGEAVLANRSSLHLVLLNLISNACKFVSPGTKPQVRLRSERRDSRVRLWVEDNGIGITPDDQKHLFAMFKRLKRGDYPGTGMGLAIVKTAVERMGGCVGIESQPGRGSKFWVELNMARGPDPDRVPATHRTAEAQLVS
jgi:PAS domain S-box-containing protein